MEIQPQNCTVFEYVCNSAPLKFLTHTKADTQHSVWAKHAFLLSFDICANCWKWIHSSMTPCLYGALFSVFFLHKCFQNESMSARGHMNRPSDSSVNIRTSCCAARRPAAESLFGLSRVWFCRSPPPTEESRGYWAPIREIITELIYIRHIFTAGRIMTWLLPQIIPQKQRKQSLPAKFFM